jgi:hypothetical protein
VVQLQDHPFMTGPVLVMESGGTTLSMLKQKTLASLV